MKDLYIDYIDLLHSLDPFDSYGNIEDAIENYREPQEVIFNLTEILKDELTPEQHQKAINLLNTYQLLTRS